MRVLFRSAFLVALLLQAAILPVSAQVVLPVVQRLPLVRVDDDRPENGQIYTESHPDAPMTGIAFSIPAGIDQQMSHMGGVASLLATLIAYTPVLIDGAKRPLYEAINARGASFVYSVEDSVVTFTVEVRSERAAEVLGFLAAAVAKPAFDLEHLALARHHLLEELRLQAVDPATVGMSTFRSAFYRDSLQGMPFSGTPAEVLAIHLTQLRQMYARNYRRSGAAVAIVGVVTSGTTATARALVDSLAPGESPVTPLQGWAPFPANSSVIATANIPSPVFVLGFKAPAVTSPDFGAMYVLSTIFQVSLARDETTTSLEDSYRLYRVRYDFMSSPANVTLMVTSPGDAYMTAVRTSSIWIEALSGRLLDTQTVAALKRMTAGRYITEAVAPTQEASRIVALASLGLGPNAANEVLSRINAVTPADLQRVARQYCANPIYARVGPLNETAP